MQNKELNNFNKIIADKTIIISNLSNQYSEASTPEELMWCAIQLQNHANALRVSFPGFILSSREVYGGKKNE